MRRFLLGLGCLLGFACTPVGDPPLPPELVGRWVTDAPDYEDRAIQITDGVLVFDLGDEALRVHRILEVETSPLGAQTAYVLRYRNEAGVRDELHIFHEPKDDLETLRLRNLELIEWTRLTAP